MATTTNYGWETPDDTDLVKDGASAIRTLGSSIDTTTKNLNPETTLGDISYRSSTSNTNTRLAIGSTGDVLTVSGGVPAWAAPSSGGVTLISRQTPSASTGFSFSSIPATYKQLLLVWHGLYSSNTSTTFNLRLENVAGNYQVFYYYFSSGSGTNVTGGFAGTTAVNGALPLVTNNNTQNNDNVSSGRLIIYDYASTTKDKKYFYDNRLNDGNQKMEYANGVFGENGAITSIDIVRTAGTGTVSTLTDGYIDLFGVK